MSLLTARSSLLISTKSTLEILDPILYMTKPASRKIEIINKAKILFTELPPFFFLLFLILPPHFIL